AALCGMVRAAGHPSPMRKKRGSVALSMLGTTTIGAMRAKELMEGAGYELVAFHQNGTGGIAMEDMIAEGLFDGVLDLNLHEIGDSVYGGLHASIRGYRLERAGALGIPQVVAPGSINYTVLGPLNSLTPEERARKLIVHNPNLTLVRLSHEEMVETALITARKLNAAKGPLHVFIPLKGFSYPDREGLPHWDPEGNTLFIETLKKELDPAIPYDEVNAHINDREFVDRAVGEMLKMLETRR
ncbi:MAG: Tm-1-like ATP-binding domain-containing protein, partial [Rectinemataceae bacterium]